MAAFNTMARAPDDEVEELHMFIAIADKNTDARKQDKITGSKWIGCVPVKRERILKLAMNNHDHFLPHARSVYLSGHQLVLRKARESNRPLYKTTVQLKKNPYMSRHCYTATIQRYN